MTNKFLNAGEVVVGVESKYCSNNGAYELAYVWTGKDVRIENYANAYNQGAHDDAVVNASPEQVKAAGDWWESYSNERNNSYDGCTVILSRSRKAPNKVPLKVIQSEPAYYNDYNQRVDAQIHVELEAGSVWVNQSCIAEVVKVPRPFWATK